MAVKHVVLCILTASIASACRRAPPASTEPPKPEPLSVTRWTEKTELFAEYPPLVAGATSRFAIHLTHLDSFKPLTEGRIEVHLRGADGGRPEVFTVDAPSRPGIFGVDVRSATAGKRDLVIVVRSARVQDEHQVGEVEVFRSDEAARAAAPADGEKAPGISFLKEQQWTLDFATAVVREQSVRESIRVPARIEPRAGGSADVVAPIDGRLTHVIDAPLGVAVSQGQELARLLPPPPVPGDLPQLQRAQSDARTSLDLASRDRERAERLVQAGAAPQKRLDEARASETQARARLAAADDSLTQYTAARTAAAGPASSQFLVRAPIAGVIAARSAATGSNVSAGSTLFRIVDAADVLVVGHVPEGDAMKARTATAGEIEAAGVEGRMPAGRLSSMGRVVDPEVRTIPVSFTFDNHLARLPVGQAVFLHLLMQTNAARPIVPESAIVDDAGRPIVFVQREGETFERRAVTLGARAGNVVQVLDGVKSGERVVTRGAFLVRLASLSTQVPSHGHVH